MRAVQTQASRKTDHQRCHDCYRGGKRPVNPSVDGCLLGDTRCMENSRHRLVEMLTKLLALPVPGANLCGIAVVLAVLSEEGR